MSGDWLGASVETEPETVTEGTSANVVRPSGPGLRDKFRGALVGAAVGDALGAPFEGAASVSWSTVEKLEREPGPLRYTDDTHMTLGVARSLVGRRGFDGDHMSTLLARNYMEEPWRGYGAGPPQVFHLLSQGVPWDQSGSRLFGGSGSYGNGAAMRVAPVALLGFHDMERVVSLARQTAVITHAHELGIDGAVLQACAITLALRHQSSEPVDSGAFLDRLSERVHSGVYQQKLERARSLLARGEPEGRRSVIAQLGNGISAFESVPTAIYAFLRRPESFKDVVTYAISLGGDTDTIASMAGALGGAYLGLTTIPAVWSNRVEGAAELLELADSSLLFACEARC